MSIQILHIYARDVRRVILVNVRPGPLTIPAILGRTRDVDSTVRRSVYNVVLNPDTPGKEDLKSELDVGVTHLRALSITQRELIVRNGLGDREETVKAAAVKLLTCWMDTVLEHGDKPEGEEEQSNVIAFLKLFDLFQTSVPEDALLSVFSARPDVLDSLEFPRTSLSLHLSPLLLTYHRQQRHSGVTSRPREPFSFAYSQTIASRRKTKHVLKLHSQSPSSFWRPRSKACIMK